ncbi:MAG TPA: hypothetical protein PLO23_10235, partial [Alphaproteobacteria bacterium]|nr:hypothetical protein [Alphaproteobacteria bacterium]
MMNGLEIHLAPLIPPGWLAALALIGMILLAVSMLASGRFQFWRALVLAAFLFALAGPSVLEEDRKPMPDVAVIAMDASPSQSFAQRMERTQAAKAYLETRLGSVKDLEVRVVESESEQSPASETSIFKSLDRALADVPQNRRAGVFIVTDGQVHDVPKDARRWSEYGPVHALLSGEKGERDMRIVLTRAPAFGIVGQDIEIAFKVEASEEGAPSAARVQVQFENGQGLSEDVVTGEESVVRVPLEHAGQNVFELKVDGIAGEITEANNQAVVLVNGVRDRLRVLLVSGQPHAGGRTWRDLLTSDPGVDLVHFTILREPSKLDNTPQDELSLIAFPFRELFEIKLHDFDLIIFDRYRLNDVVPDRYFANIARFVEKGGALLAAS